MFNIYRKVRRQNFTVQKVTRVTARESRREEADRRLTARPIRTSTPSDGKTNATKNQLFPYWQHKTERRIFITQSRHAEIAPKSRQKPPKTRYHNYCTIMRSRHQEKKPPNISKKPHQLRRNNHRRTQKRQNSAIGITQKKVVAQQKTTKSKQPQQKP